MLALTVESLSLSFGIKRVLCDVSFSLEENDRLGVIGVNGSGKSTLFKLLLGELSADSGAVYISKGKSVGILRQDDAVTAFSEQEKEMSAIEVMYNSFPELLLAEERLKSLEEILKKENPDSSEYLKAVGEYSSLNEKFIAEGGLEFRARCSSTLLKMGFDKEAQKKSFNAFSGGQRTRLALSRELCREPDILLLDEPTNHLDMETLIWLESFLASYKKCLLVISHDRYFLDRVTNKTLLIENNRAKLYNGGYTASMEQRRIDREIAERHYKNQQKEIARQEAYIAQQRAWNRERNIIAAESRQKLLDKIERVEKPTDSPRGIKISFANSSAPSGNEVMNIHGLSFGYSEDKLILKNLNLGVRRLDRLFLVGANGSGKSTLVKLMLSKLTPSKGYIEMGYNVELGYYDQENQNLSPDNTVIEELWSAYPHLTELEIRNTLAHFRFFGDMVFLKVRELSGGERARLTLSKLILSKTNLLVLDEPTNHLDIDSREALESALEEYEGTVIIVSHDRYFIEKLATRIIDIEPVCDGGATYDITIPKVGEGYAELCRERERRALGKTEANCEPLAISEAKEQYLKNKKETSDLRKAQKRRDRLEREARRIEDELSKIEGEINGEAAYDYNRLTELDNEKNALEERLFEIYEELEG